jgi:hypothetical protein
VDSFNLHPQTEPVLSMSPLLTRMIAISPQDQVGKQYPTLFSVLNIAFCADMLGFKLEMPRREGSLKEKTRPIYLDMQVRVIACSSRYEPHIFYFRPLHLLILVYLMPCYHISRTSTVTRIVARMHMDGRLSRLWRMLAKYGKHCCLNASRNLTARNTARRGSD